jgi:hypothetical protein
MRYLLTLTVFIIFNQVISCQAENIILADITGKFQAYCKAFPREEVFVETDRSIYIAGEDVWFSIWLFNRQKETISDLSGIAYVEILSPSNKPVVQKRFGLDTGTGSGRISLPDTLSQGVYILRAYTSWMKNFMPENCFSRKLKVYGTSENQDFLVPDPPQSIVSGQNPVNNMINIRTSREKQGIVQVEIISGNQFRNANSNPCYLIVQTHGIINFKKVINLAGDTTGMELPSEGVLPGINQFTLFDSKGNPACETYSYTPRRQSDMMCMDIRTPDSCRSREPVSIVLDAAGNVSTDDTAFLSISIVPAGSISRAGISDYLVFGSEFGWLPDIFMEKSLENIPDSIIDNFLSGVKSNWIDWNLILADKMPEIKYKKEDRYHYLSGSTFSGLVNDSSTGHHVFLSIPGRNATLQYSKIRPDGNFEFCLPADNKIRDLVLQADVPLGNNKIILTSSFSDRYSDVIIHKYSDTVRASLIRKLALNHRVMKIYRSFEPSSGRAQEKLTAGSVCFYGKPDFELIMSDYIALPTIQEVFFELIPGVSIGSENRGHKITIRDAFNGRLLEDPLLLIDGVVVRDPELISDIDPQLVEKIDVIKSRYVFGDYLFSGILNVITTKGDIGNVTLSEDVSRFRYRTFESPEKFAYPDYSLTDARNSHIPDFRNTLYWNTFTLKGSDQAINLTFRASDNLSDYDIVVQGRTNDGRFVSERGKIRITKYRSLKISFNNLTCNKCFVSRILQPRRILKP